MSEVTYYIVVGNRGTQQERVRAAFTSHAHAENFIQTRIPKQEQHEYVIENHPFIRETGDE